MPSECSARAFRISLDRAHMIPFVVAPPPAGATAVERGSPAAARAARFSLQSHLNEIVAVDFFTVPTVRSRVLFVFLVFGLARRWTVPLFFASLEPSSDASMRSRLQPGTFRRGGDPAGGESSSTAPSIRMGFTGGTGVSGPHPATDPAGDHRAAPGSVQARSASQLRRIPAARYSLRIHRRHPGVSLQARNGTSAVRWFSIDQLG